LDEKLASSVCRGVQYLVQCGGGMDSLDRAVVMYEFFIKRYFSPGVKENGL